MIALNPDFAWVLLLLLLLLSFELLLLFLITPLIFVRREIQSCIFPARISNNG